MPWYRELSQKKGKETAIKDFTEWKLPASFITERLKNEKTAEEFIQKASERELKSKLGELKIESDVRLESFNKIDDIERKGGELSHLHPDEKKQKELVQTAFERLTGKAVGVEREADAFNPASTAIMSPTIADLVLRAIQQEMQRYESLRTQFKDIHFEEDFRSEYRKQIRQELAVRNRVRETWKMLDLKQDEARILNKYSKTDAKANRLIDDLMKHMNLRDAVDLIKTATELELAEYIPEDEHAPADVRHLEGAEDMKRALEEQLEEKVQALRDHVKIMVKAYAGMDET